MRRYEGTAKLIRGLFLAVLLGGSARSAWAIDPGRSLAQCTVDLFGVRDGLSGAPILAITQTSDGYLWIGGTGGVRRYDGAHVRRAETEAPLDVTALVPGTEGVLAIRPRGAPVCIRHDLRPGCSSDELARLTSQRSAPASPPELRVVHRDRQGRLWAGTRTGLYLQKGDAFVRMDAPERSSSAPSPFRSIADGAHGTVWAVDDHTLWRIEGEHVTARALPEDSFQRARSQVIEDRDGNVWIGSDAGLARFRDGHFVTYTLRDGLPDDDVTAVFEDREGSLWIGTRRGGLAQFTDRTLAVQSGPPSLKDEPIESISEDAAGVLWFASWRGLTRWKAGQERTFTRADGLPEDRVNVVLPGLEGDLWLGSPLGLTRWRGARPEGFLPWADAITALKWDHAGTLWVGTDGGIARLVNGRLQPVPPQDGLVVAHVRGLEEDGEGRIWAATSGGLVQIERDRVVPVLSDGLRIPATHGIGRDQAGTLWLGSGTMLVHHGPGGWQRFGGAAGFARGQIFQLLDDQRGFLWLELQTEIARVSLRSLDEVAAGRRERAEMITFDTSDARRNLDARRARTPGSWRTQDGRLWLATLRGPVTIDPDRVRPNPIPPGVFVDRATVDGQPLAPGGTNPLSPGSGKLEVDFSVVTLLEPRKALVRYRLDGFDETWIDAGERRTASYTNLPPGRYGFRVEASNADGLWNEAGAMVAFGLASRFYRTVTFFAACVLAALGLGWMLHRARMARLRGRYEVVFAERTRVARELHDTLLQGLAGVAMQIRSVRKRVTGGAAPEALSRDLKSIENVVASNVEATRQFVWNLRDQTDTAKLPDALSELATRLTAGTVIAARVKVVGEPVPVSLDVHYDLFRVAQEAITNAVKHASAGNIEVRLRYQGRGVTLSVSDDGCGFDPSRTEGAASGHFGLIGMRERVARLGVLMIDSSPAGGTTITVDVSMKRGATHA